MTHAQTEDVLVSIRPTSLILNQPWWIPNFCDFQQSSYFHNIGQWNNKVIKCQKQSHGATRQVRHSLVGPCHFPSCRLRIKGVLMSEVVIDRDLQVCNPGHVSSVVLHHTLHGYMNTVASVFPVALLVCLKTSCAREFINGNTNWLTILPPTILLSPWSILFGELLVRSSSQETYGT
jgi:hypothetical protein